MSTLKELDAKVTEIKDNHIVHIYERLSLLEGQMSLNTKLTIAILTTLVGSLALQVYKVL